MSRRRSTWEFVLPEGTMRSLAFLAGLALTIREALVRGPERPSLYVLFGGMMGGSIIWGKGERFFRRPGEDDEEGGA